jgi:2-polyprenyl-3-methyl-5-hydroxy-6-metoxy-1,4-benzoquinol methylase
VAREQRGAAAGEAPCCALCGSRATTRLFTPRPGDSETQSAHPFWCCEECGARFVHPQPDWNERNRHYTEAYPGYLRLETAPGALVAHSMAFGLRRRARFIERFARPGLLLDVGCGGGDLMAILAARGWRPMGVEAMAPMAAAAAARSACPALVGDGAALAVASGSCDVVLLWTTLEHAADPRRTLAECARALRPGGLLILNTTSTRSLIAHVTGRHWMGYDTPRVLFVFSPASLRNLLVQSGLHLEWMGGHTNDFHPLLWSLRNWCAARARAGAPCAALCRLLVRVAGSLPVRLATWPLLRLLTATGRGSFVAVVARKAAA